MGRCGCSSAEAVGAAIADSDCIHATGAGTSGDPFVIDPVIDSDASNRLNCGADGLLVALPLSLVVAAPATGATPVAGGTWPPDFTAVQFEAIVGQSIVTTDGGGSAAIDWPSFANGIAVLNVTPSGTIASPNPNSSWQITIHDAGLSGCHVQCDHSDGTAIPGGLLAVNLFVIGW